MLDPKYFAETYSGDDIARLCAIGGLQPDDTATMRKELEDFAAVYRWEASKHADLPRSSAVARDLEALLKRIGRLDDGLEHLPDEVAHFLMMAIERNNSKDWALDITKKLPKDAASLTISLPEDALPLTGLHLGIPDIRQILSGLERATRDAIGSLPNRGRGQLRDHGLRLWMCNIESFWERNATVPFTRDETDAGEPITPAARFCVAAFHCISPDYAVSRILWEMRDRIRQSKK